MTDIRQLVTDLRAEQDALDQVVTHLSDGQWKVLSPSPGWTVADQIGHLTYFDGVSALAIEDPEAFRVSATQLMAADDIDALTLQRSLGPVRLLAAWRANRARLIATTDRLDESTRLPWYGPSMGAKSFLTARLMECWAHGHDVRETVGAPSSATDRLRHVAQLGFRTRGWSYVNRGLEPLTTPVRLELLAPSGAVWRFGPIDAGEVIRGSAFDFCLVVTQRRHFGDTELVVEGGAARDWMEKAQVFAGRATNARPQGAKA